MNEEKFNDKWNRMSTAIRLEEGDRVPFSPKVCGYYSYQYGPSMYDIMMDMRNALPAIDKYLEEFDPDLVWPIATYPIQPVLKLDCSHIKVPGPTHGIALDAPSFQFVDGTYMQDDEFDDFLTDPTQFLISKIMPSKFRALEGFSKFYCGDIYDQSMVMNMAVFANEDFKQAMAAATRAGEEALIAIQNNGMVAKHIHDMGYPAIGGRMVAPFDIYADSLRGLVQATIDVMEDPDLVVECVERIGKMTTPRAIAAAKARGAKVMFIPLHAGVDEFMSPEAYEKVYWPTLKDMIDGLVDAGIVPYVFCEGKYNSRLEIISDVPKGKVVYMFEEVDIKRAKEIVGKNACIAGNIPTATLIAGSPEDVKRATMKMIDDCAPGGGFIMDCSIVLDNAKYENMIAWRDTTLEYGRY